MSESKAHQVEIREVDGQTLRKLVDYIYTAEIEVTEDNVQVRVCMLAGKRREKGFFSFPLLWWLLSCFQLFKCFKNIDANSYRVSGILATVLYILQGCVFCVSQLYLSSVEGFSYYIKSQSYKTSFVLSKTQE